MTQRDPFKRAGQTGGQDWAHLARDAIYSTHRRLPPTTSLEDRMAAIDAAYPFEVRAHYPYTVWCRERRKYLKPYGYVAQNEAPSSPQTKPKGPTS